MHSNQFVYLARLTRLNGVDIPKCTSNPEHFGTIMLGPEPHNWPGFLSFDDFENWPDDYDTYHTPLPNHCAWEEIGEDDLPLNISNLKSKEGNWDIWAHIFWMLEDAQIDEEEIE